MAPAGGRPDLKVVKSAAEHTWRELDVRIYPDATSVRWVVFTRISRGTDHWDRHVASGAVDLGDAAQLQDAGAVLRACSDALAAAADKRQ